MKYSAPRGTHDIWGEQAEKISRLENISRDIFKKYNFSEIKIPTFEDVELFTRSIGETTDIVEKEMYVFEDKKGRKLSLRPEGTAGVVRAYIENNLVNLLPVNKLFYIGSMFRYERPQAGRYREFFQTGCEYFNNPDPSCDAEVVVLALEILNSVGLTGLKTHINSLGCKECRPNFRKNLVDYLKAHPDLCEDCLRRIDKNPLRVLDCKIDSHKLGNIPKMEDCLCQNCSDNFSKVREMLTGAKVEFVVDHKLVRGLDYYTRTIFEIRAPGLGAQDTVAAGGRYDSLVHELGGPETPAMGFALGQERVIIACDTLKTNIIENKRRIVFVAVSGTSVEKDAFKFACELRSKKNDLTVEGPFASKSFKAQFKLADRISAGTVVVFGEEELKRNAVSVKDMVAQQQKEVLLSEILGLF
jgi:histidyl-tRNA synthetase